MATPPSRVVRMEEADEGLLAVKGAIHDLVSSSCTSGKKGTGAGRGCEPRTHLQRVGSPDTEDNDRVRHPRTGNDHNQKDTDETAS